MVERIPIVYVRGYAGGTSGINKQVDDPFYGFNLGSTHVRVGRKGDPVFYQFESPLLRLVTDERYQVLVHGNQKAFLESQPDGSIPPETIWIHRFYDISASTFGAKPLDFSLPKAAEDLLSLIEKLQVKTGAQRVHLVAHSMGGLICRCLIQKLIPERRAGKKATDYISRLFTYGTPHGGISFDPGFGLLEKIRDEFGLGGADWFSPAEMYSFLTPKARKGDKPPRGWKPEVMPKDDNFPLDRIFCLVGTNPEDYSAALGISSKAVGAKSDGLVQIENAYVPGANQAFVHRSHSGRYGLVNSEEGYQNLRRFLFGQIKVTGDLVGLKPEILRGEKHLVWQAEIQLSIRELPVVMAERMTAHYSPIQLSDEERGSADRPVPLVTTFIGLSSHLKKRMRYVLHLRVLSLEQVGGIFGFGDHLEQASDFDDILVVDNEWRETGPVAWAEWNSVIGSALRDYEPKGEPLSDADPASGIWSAKIPLPANARDFLGSNAAVVLTARAHL
jgi:pimeloyl-ACP methyl ester carboxylesterase